MAMVMNYGIQQGFDYNKNTNQVIQYKVKSIVEAQIKKKRKLKTNACLYIKTDLY